MLYRWDCTTWRIKPENAKSMLDTASSDYAAVARVYFVQYHLHLQLLSASRCAIVCYICVLPHTTTYVSSCYSMCPHATVYVSSCSDFVEYHLHLELLSASRYAGSESEGVCLERTFRSAAIYVFSYYYICVLMLLYVSSCYCICVFILLYRYAESKGVCLKGDIPIGVTRCSAS
jgi:hypothetical protein